jgi:protein gp37
VKLTETIQNRLATDNIAEQEYLEQNIPDTEPVTTDESACPLPGASESALDPVGSGRTVWSARDILTQVFLPIVWCIIGLLPPGLVFLAGKPKVGKSWFALQMAGAIGMGKTFLGRAASAGLVHYYALEDGTRRLRDRMDQQGWSPSAQVDFESEPPSDTSELVNLIAGGQVRLIIIDTFSRCFPGIDQNNVSEVTSLLGPIQQAALHNDCTILIIDHLRKGESADQLDQVLGSQGKTSVADAIMLLNRGGTVGNAKLYVTGRDVEAAEIELEFDSSSGTWQEHEPANSAKEDCVLKALSDMGGRATAAQLTKKFSKKSEYPGLHDHSNMAKVLQSLVDRGLIVREPKHGREVYYRLEETSEPGDGTDDDWDKNDWGEVRGTYDETEDWGANPMGEGCHQDCIALTSVEVGSGYDELGLDSHDDLDVPSDLEADEPTSDMQDFIGEHPIRWTDRTWNPIRGCRPKSPGCKNCYAPRSAIRHAGTGKAYEGLVKSTPDGPKWTGKIRMVQDVLRQPYTWKKGKYVFVNSMSDLFYEDLPEESIQEVFTVMSDTPWHTYQILTKRSERLLDLDPCIDWPDNVWMGVSVENNDYLHRIDDLKKTGATVKWLSLEPLLGPLTDLDLTGIDWVVVGGEAGPGARPMDEEWVCQIRDKCVAAGVPFFFKQWGGVRKKENGYILQGKIWGEMPIKH